MQSIEEIRELVAKWDKQGGIKTSAYYRLLKLLHEMEAEADAKAKPTKATP